MKLPSVRLSVCLSRYLTAARRCCRFAAVRPADRLLPCLAPAARTPSKLAGWRAGVNPLYIVHHSNEQTSKHTFSVCIG